jgi:TolB-like protein
MPDIFLSYTREDVAVAQAYRDAFARDGLDVWWDATLRSGEAYDEVTEAALRRAKAVVVLWSPRSVASRWVRAEATIAERSRTLMPVTIEPCDRPVMFELTQTADLAHWKGEAGDKAWLAFLGDVRRRVGRGEPGPAAVESAPSGGAAGVANVGVLPITCRDGDHELEPLAEELTEEITRELAPSPFFKVVAASTMAAWRGKSFDHRTLGRELEARYLIEARLQRSGESLRLTTQLIDAATGGMLQSDRLSRRLAEVEASTEVFAGTAAGHLGVLILQIEMDRAVSKTGLLSGWDHVFRARACTQSTGSDNASRFVTEAREAVAALPELNLAHAMLACALAIPVAAGTETLDEARSREIQAHIKRALQFGATSSVVIGYLMVAYDGLGDGEACLRLARRAVELSPNSPRAQYLVGAALLKLGRTSEAIAAFEDYDRLSSTDDARNGALTMIGQCYFLERRLPEAETALDEALAFQADSALALKWKAVVASRRGDEKLALATARRLREAEPDMTVDQHVRQITRWPKLAERSAEAVAELRRLWAQTEGEP